MNIEDDILHKLNSCVVEAGSVQVGIDFTELKLLCTVVKLTREHLTFKDPILLAEGKKALKYALKKLDKFKVKP